MEKIEVQRRRLRKVEMLVRKRKGWVDVKKKRTTRTAVLEEGRRIPKVSMRWKEICNDLFLVLLFSEKKKMKMHERGRVKTPMKVIAFSAFLHLL